MNPKKELLWSLWVEPLTDPEKRPGLLFCGPAASCDSSRGSRAVAAWPGQVGLWSFGFGLRY